jgi:hypothetical protein
MSESQEEKRSSERDVMVTLRWVCICCEMLHSTIHGRTVELCAGHTWLPPCTTSLSVSHLITVRVQAVYANLERESLTFFGELLLFFFSFGSGGGCIAMTSRSCLSA